AGRRRRGKGGDENGGAPEAETVEAVDTDGTEGAEEGAEGTDGDRPPKKRRSRRGRRSKPRPVEADNEDGGKTAEQDESEAA
ncbi:MAG: hypothetical protein QOF65_2174, partial [Thermoleophilaceae bacterium]|nr:hypothetical protein [Thermoleophilaceae bacterium]